MLTQAVGWSGTRFVATMQSLTPYGIPVVLTISAIGVWRQREALATTGALIGVGAFLLSTPLVIPPGQASPDDDATGVSVASINLLFSNPAVEAVADDLLERDPDVIFFAEYTTEHHETLVSHSLADRYPFRIDRDGRFARGVSLWSKFPVDENDRRVFDERTIDVTLSGPDGLIRLLGVHPPTPVFDFSKWVGGLDRIGVMVSESTQRLLVIGDFNASYWHPPFRALLRRDLTDAHIAHGRGWSTSWPTDQVVPPFVRLDHALTGNGLVSTDVTDFRVPGSDHVGFVVTVTPSG